MATTRIPHPPEVGLFDMETMRAAAAVLLASDAPFLRQDELEDRRRLLRGYITELVPVVEDLAMTRPVESLPRAAAVDTVETARAQIAIAPGPGLVAAVRHVRALARDLRALCNHHDMLTGARLPGVA
jgi:hypothetical protein